jgi:hypothetical protein
VGRRRLVDVKWPRVVAAVVGQHLFVVDRGLFAQEGSTHDEILEVDCDLHRFSFLL